MSAGVRVARVREMTVAGLHDMKSAAIDVEMDIALIGIRRDSFPDLYFGVQLLDLAPIVEYELLTVVRLQRQ